MGGGSPSVNESTSAMMQALAAYAPAAIKAISDTAPGVARQQLAITKELAPQQAAFDNELYATYGPEANRIGSEIEAQRQMAASESELALARGPGQGLIREADLGQRILDPEFYRNREALSQAMDAYYKQANAALNPTENEETLRILAREGPLPDSALRTQRNLQAFGDRATDKWMKLGQALTQSSAALPNMRSGINAFEVATRRPLYSNTGEGRLKQSEAVSPNSALNTSFGFADQALNQIGSTQRQAIAKKKDALDIFGGVTSGIGNVIGFSKGL